MAIPVPRALGEISDSTDPKVHEGELAMTVTMVRPVWAVLVACEVIPVSREM
jgi:hypothetical protein